MQVDATTLSFSEGDHQSVNVLTISFSGGDAGAQTRLRITLGDDAGSQFGQDGCTGAYANAQSCDLTITYKAARPAKAILTIHNDSRADDPDRTIELRGTPPPPPTTTTTSTLRQTG
jgi:hypothetical protein